MKTIMVSYYDTKLGVYSQPSFLPETTNENIIEEMRRMCANPKMPKIYFEYDLYKLGVFDDKVGTFEFSDKPEFLISLGEFRHLAREEEEDVKVN